ncbi:hypothetical protein V2A60_003045 [Cordyceps javanica]|uniref:30S ribosomal subunit S4 n=1 Tax=Cordyceps javanica TaxID=43265 RepID=A0A545V4E3_9HYPO|nr:30S ribosomal subunit S4 [Cordyceps javanica]TQW07846.1 30S ribosomal subunit S4 [Cordyceps javanica]
MRKPARFFSLAKPKLRQSWNKYNMYNIYRNAAREPIIRGTPTFFQQKWGAKSRARAYHGEHIPEKKWVRLFSPRLMSAVDMPPEYLAAHDGSEQAAGRGSGLSTSNVNAQSYSRVPVPVVRQDKAASPNELISRQYQEMTPYMQMTFAPLERRLDTAIFRAMFATSVRQARQFVLHGAVKVNGKKLLHPSYQLNPGDMFQVDIEKVMYATGVQKSSKNSLPGLEQKLASRKKISDRDHISSAEKYAAPAEGQGEGEAAANASVEAVSEGSEAAQGDAALPELSEEAQQRWQRNELKAFLRRCKALLALEAKHLTAKEKQSLRLLRSDAKRLLSRPQDSELDVSELMQELQLVIKNQEVLAKLNAEHTPGDQATAMEGGETAGEQQFSREKQYRQTLDGLSEEQKERAKEIVGSARLSNEDMRRLKALLLADEENPVDETKPYATPWAPRPFMAAFAFIPRYLEVNHDICAAVYLRHPVARKGRAEVPTPFSYLTNQLAHNCEAFRSNSAAIEPGCGKSDDCYNNINLGPPTHASRRLNVAPSLPPHPTIRPPPTLSPPNQADRLHAAIMHKTPGPYTERRDSSIADDPGPALKKKKSRRGAESSNQKRKCISTACIACRKRKSKCDGAVPSCAACASVYGTECIYDPNSDHRRKGVYREKTDGMKADDATLKILVEAILNADEDDVDDVVRRIRNCDSLDNLAQQLLKDGPGGPGSSAEHSSDEHWPAQMDGERELAAYSDASDTRTKGDHFFAEAKRLIMEGDEFERPRLVTVQALALMSVREAGCAREATGWVYSGMSFRMAQDIGLNLEISPNDKKVMTDEEIDARRITFWGCFNFDKCWSNYLGRLPQLPKSTFTVAKFDVFPDEDASPWVPLTDKGFDESAKQPSRTRAAALLLSSLCEISSDLLLFFYHPNHIHRSSGKTIELKKLSELHKRLEEWRKNLPKEFEAGDGQLPNVILMHMFFHLQFIHLFRPFLKYSPSSSPLPSHISPRRICTSNAGAISKLMRLYKKHWNLRQICNIAVYMTHSACTIHLLNLPEKTAKRDFTHGIKHLEEISEDWLCARRTLSILSVLARKWNCVIPEDAAQILQRTDELYGHYSTSEVPSPKSSTGLSPQAPTEETTAAQAHMQASHFKQHPSPGRVQFAQSAMAQAAAPQASISARLDMNNTPVTPQQQPSQPQQDLGVTSQHIAYAPETLDSWGQAIMTTSPAASGYPTTSAAGLSSNAEAIRGFTGSRIAPSGVLTGQGAGLDNNQWILNDSAKWQHNFNGWDLGQSLPGAMQFAFPPQGSLPLNTNPAVTAAAAANMQTMGHPPSNLEAFDASMHDTRWLPDLE